MIATAKRQWVEIRSTAPGLRFRNHYLRNQADLSPNLFFHWVGLTVGVFLIGMGLVLLFTPGPGLIFIVFGGSVVASRSLRMATLFDHWEIEIRRMISQGLAHFSRCIHRRRVRA